MKKIFMSILACGLLTIGLCGCGHQTPLKMLQKQLQKL